MRSIITEWGLGGANSSCLPAPLARRTDGKVSCDLIVELPAKGQYPQTAATECTGPLFSPIQVPHRPLNPGGGMNCKLAQLAVKDGVRESGEGFYYDDMVGDDNKQLCGQNRGTSIRFTDGGYPGIMQRMYLDCDPDAFH